MRKILSIIFCLFCSTQMLAQAVTSVNDTFDDGIIGERRHAVPLIGTDSLGKYLQSNISQETLLGFNNYYANKMTFELQIDSNGNLRKIRPIYNSQLNESICVEIIKNIESISAWKPTITIVNGHERNIDSRILMFVYLHKITVDGQSAMVININLR